MENNELLACITFFKSLKIQVKEVTTEQEKEDGLKVVIVDYNYEGQVHTTKKLFYKEISLQEHVYNTQTIKDYFDDKVYWLDIKIHEWPDGPGTNIEKKVIEDMYDGDNLAFNTLLKKIANDQKTGFLQKITMDGRSQQYGLNLTNNNHWHDLILLIQETIRTNGTKPNKVFFAPLVFNWRTKKRTSLSPKLGDRLLIKKLINNIQMIQPTLSHLNLQEVLLAKKQIILQGPPGTGKTYTAKNLAEQLIFGEITENKQAQKRRLETTEQFELVQFHPSYSYEDFVRGISAKSEDGNIYYEAENKILGIFADKAQQNLEESKKEVTIYSREQQLEKLMKEFGEQIQEEIDENGIFVITQAVSITNVEHDAFRYKGNWKSSQRMKFKDLVIATISEVSSRQELIDTPSISGLAKQHASYYFKVLEVFKKRFKSKLSKTELTTSEKPQLKNYILIIDEINRANLPSVLGELIYALEYRGELVNSMYAIDGDNSIVLPENLYIVGTMNTADRSVGHIDYAIKRRFAFIDLLPNETVIKNEKAKLLFQKVAALFVKSEDGEQVNSDYLASDFDFKEVQLGHSYFIVENEKELEIRLNYEIIPILKEYVKDGLLLETAKSEIKKLAQF